MTNVQPAPTQALAITALTSGLLGVVLLALFFFTTLGPVPLYAALVLGIVAVIVGIVALRKHQSKPLAVTGLIIGAIIALFTIGLVLFALVFVGAISF